MFSYCKKYIFPLVLFFFLTANQSGVYSQVTKVSLTNERKQLEKELAQQKKLLDETTRNRKASLREIQLLTNQIKKQEKLIQTITSELSCLDVEIETVTEEIAQLQVKLDELIKEYEKAIYIAYKHRDVLLKTTFIISAENIHQAVKRMRYLQEYSNALNHHMKLIKETQKAKKSKEESLISIKQDKICLLDNKSKEKTNLQQQQQQKDKLVVDLRKKESQINKEIAAKVKRQKAIDAQIAKIVEAELAKAKATTKASPKIAEANVTLANDFANNQGKLPWPVDNGTIITGFGTYSHPEVSSVKITNNGINILTDKTSQVRAVFKGKVSTVTAMDGANVVIISHGTYLTVYSNLGTVYVKAGDNVNTKQVIGTMKAEPNDSKSELHFEIRRERTPLNPVQWISR